ncbi:tetratricopeptide repeat protein [Accumulibacter sp.]|uniref:nuclear transport factor 2 family protein n=2 Tax=Accumulibacter sp. TaxID=2053492 RepID=UPI0015990FB7|nr:MAG: tetratricopeptide repeat protein [Candidatus Accumulibacter similis]
MRPSLLPAIRSLLLAWALAGVVPAALADDLAEAQRLLKEGQQAAALERIEDHLASNPGDARGRFSKGLILVEMGRPADAMTVFSKLIEDYPELPEPYNNLAVLYAQQKQYDKARTALEMAIRIQPNYATAYENLGDIHARLAGQAYEKALQIDPARKAARLKLSRMREAGSGSLGDAGPGASRLSDAAVAGKADRVPAVAGDADEKEVARTIEAWARAWSRKDAKAYFAHYAADFRAPRGMTRKSWEEGRLRPMRKPGRLQVEVEDIRVAFADGKATVRFRQTFSSPALTSTVAKTLVLVRSGGRWLIQEERVG